MQLRLTAVDAEPSCAVCCISRCTQTAAPCRRPHCRCCCIARTAEAPAQQRLPNNAASLAAHCGWQHSSFNAAHRGRDARWQSDSSRCAARMLPALSPLLLLSSPSSHRLHHCLHQFRNFESQSSSHHSALQPRHRVTALAFVTAAAQQRSSSAPPPAPPPPLPLSISVYSIGLRDSSVSLAVAFTFVTASLSVACVSVPPLSAPPR